MERKYITLIFFIQWVFTLSAFSLSFAENQETNISSKAEAYFRYALAHLFEINDNIEEALKNYQLALKADPESAHIKVSIANVYLDKGQDKEAINLLEEILQKDPQNQEALSGLGTIFFNYASSKNDKKAAEKAINYFEYLKKINPQFASTYIHLGKLYSLQGNYDLAIKQYLEYINLKPYSLAGYYLLESLYEEQGKYEEAAEVFESLEKKELFNEKIVSKLLELYSKIKRVNKIDLLFEKIKKSNNYSLWKEFAKVYKELNLPDRALYIYSEIYKQQPNDLSLVIDYADLIANNEGSLSAIDFLENHIKIYGSDINLEYNLAFYYEKINKWDKAENLISSIISFIEKDMEIEQKQKEDNLKKLYYQLAYIQQEKNKNDDAIKYLNKAKEFSNVYDYKIDLLIAYNYFKMKNYDRAIEIINSALPKTLDKTDLYILIAKIKEETGKVKEAIELLEKLSKENRNNKEYIFALVEIFERKKDFKKATNYLLDYLKDKKIDERIAFRLGVIYEKQKKYEEAEKYFKKAIEINPNFAEALNYLGYMFIDLGIKIEQSIEYVKRALNIDKDNAAYIDSLGWGYYKLNKLDLALENLKKAIEILPDNPVIYDHLGDVYYKLGQYQDAINQWKQALKYKNNEIDEKKVELKIKKASSLIK